MKVDGKRGEQLGALDLRVINQNHYNITSESLVSHYILFPNIIREIRRTGQV